MRPDSAARSACQTEATPPALDASWALLLDVDGTLLDHIEDPAAVSVARELVDTLADLHGVLGGAVGLVSGRAIDDLDRLFAPLRFAAAGQHGLEIRLPDGAIQRHDAEVHLIEAAAADLARRTRAMTGILLENKGLSLTLHYRRVPEVRESVRDMARAVTDSIGDAVQLVEANHAYEIKVAGADKGQAILALMAAAPFQGRMPIFFGDDRTDEDGFRAVNHLNGISVKIGAGDTRATHRMTDPETVRRWLCAGAARYRTGACP